MPTPVTVVILAAGLGTRMKSKRAKVLHRAGGKTLLAHVIDTALHIAPPERIFVVVGHQGEQVRASVTVPGIGFIEQSEQKGTGHALMSARSRLSDLDGYLTVVYGDGPLLRPVTLGHLVNTKQHTSAAGVLLSAIMDDPTGYGRVIRELDNRVAAIVEQKSATPEQLAIREANMGIYCYRADIFWRHIDHLRPNNPAGEYYLTDMVEILHRSGHYVEALRIEDARECLGINDRIELAEADRLLRERKRREIMLAGVTIENPDTVMIDSGVSVGTDTVIGPFVQLLGTTVIGQDCSIGACSIVENCQIADGVQIGPFTMAADSSLDRGVVAGPFARLRPGNHVAEGASIGNFVELKKTTLGAGAKAHHLAYLGDSHIGARTNIGAGTITCNYDGVSKHPTTIGDDTFVGSNSTLVAPLEIGASSYIAAGSVITDAVPTDSLALGRARQIVKPEWVKKRRASQAK